MFNSLISAFAALSVSAVKWPIQTIVFIAVLASTAYFSILDFSVPNYPTSLASHYYCPPGNVSWAHITSPDAEVYANVPKFVGAQLAFAGTADDLPKIPGAHLGEERTMNVVLNQGEFGSWYQSLLDREVAGNWRLRKTFSWTVWFKWNIGRVMNLIHEADSFDLAVIGVAYLAMHYTFISLFVSMRRLGSKFWLATSVLLSSSFAFMFAFVTSHFLGVPVSMVSMTEGLPFLVVTIGFETKVTLTRLALRRSARDADKTVDLYQSIQQLWHNDGKTIFRDYAIEIFALICAACSGVNGLWQFCFLSAWILFYDCILMMTFYIAILSIKVEINKIKRNEVIRNALEEDGVSHQVAESVADSASGMSTSELAKPLRTSGVPFFKLFMIMGFVLLNAVQLTSYPMIGLRALLPAQTPQFDQALFDRVPVSQSGAVITIIPTLVFEHARLTVRFEDAFLYFFESWSKIIGDPLISKCIVLVLAVSVGMNGYLFNVARNPAVKLVEKVVEVEKRVPVVIEKTADDSSSSESEDLELKTSSTTTANQSNERSMEDCVAVMKAGMTQQLGDEEIIELSVSGKLPLYALEKQLKDNTRAVFVRRAVVSRLSSTKTLESSKLPYLHYDYDRVLGACCENVIGYTPLPIGVAGPLVVDNKPYYIPMATTEGCLVASTMRGCKALNAGGGVTTVLTQDGMTRGPCVSFANLTRAGAAKLWLDSEEGQKTMKKAFDSTSRFARLQNIKTALAGTLLFMRFRTTTGDAMGMNMISKGVEHSLKHMVENCGFEDMNVVSVSGNYCIDKKPAAINWIEGRGKSVVAEGIVPEHVVKTVLKSDVDALCELNVDKNLIGSAMAGAMGGQNAHASNLVTAIFLACGQDPAQNVESSNCITLMKKTPEGDLHISVSMPSIEVGTIGGGTILEPQAAVLDLLGVKGPNASAPGENARQLAKIVASGVLAAELSLLSALAAGHLVQSHMTHNRSKQPTPAPSSKPSMVNVEQASNLKPVDMNRLSEGSKICIKS